MRANRVSAIVFAVAASLAGCAGTSGDVKHAGDVRVSSAELIEIEPGIQVVADAEEPVFFSDGFYWLHRDGYWLRSNNASRGFMRVELSYVPERIRSIERPQTYVQYRRHMGRDRVQARANVPPEPMPPNQGVPSTPTPDTWQPGEPHHPSNPYGGINPTPLAPGGVTPIEATPPSPNPSSDESDSPGTSSDRDDQATPPELPGPGMAR